MILNKVKTLIEWILEYKLIFIIIILSFVAYFFTKHEEITFTDAINIIIALVLGYISIKADQLTSSDELRATYCTVSSIFNEWHIGEIILENKRNKPVTILAIHLQLGNNYAVNLKEYDEPLVLQPLSTIKIKLEPVSLYLISVDTKVNLQEEFKKVKEKSLVITSTDRLIKVKDFKFCPSFIGKMLLEQPFAEITSYREYWDKEYKEVVNSNTHFHAKVKDKDNKIQDIIDITYNNVVNSYKTSQIILKKEDTENATKLEQKLRAVLPYMQDDFKIEIMENKIHNRIQVEEKPLKHYGFLQTKVLNLLYKIYLRNKKL